MFRIELSESQGGIACDRILPPIIYAIPLDEYAATVEHAQEFMFEFLRLLRGKSLSGYKETGCQ